MKGVVYSTSFFYFCITQMYNMENVDKEFRWVLKVLDSSTNLRHIKTSENLFNLFLKKNSQMFKSLGKKNIYKSVCKEEFRLNMKEKIREVKKN